MDSYSEVRRVRKAMSDAAGHDISKLATMYNEHLAQVADRIIDPGTEAEQCCAHRTDGQAVSKDEPSSAAR